jgi:3-oxoacyl-[acyl-carrier protein] reductase
MIADLDAKAADAAAETLKGARGRVVSVNADVSATSTGEQLADRCVSTFGSVGILVNNAGIYPSMGLSSTPKRSRSTAYRR